MLLMFPSCSQMFLCFEGGVKTAVMELLYKFYNNFIGSLYAFIFEIQFRWDIIR